MSRGEFDKSIRRFERSLKGRFAFVEINQNLVTDAMSLARKHGLRGYDAVQLAGALQVSNRRISLRLSRLIFVCADLDLNGAAVAEGLTIEIRTIIRKKKVLSSPQTWSLIDA